MSPPSSENNTPVKASNGSLKKRSAGHSSKATSPGPRLSGDDSANTNGTPTQLANGSSSSSSTPHPPKPIDWEIPRKSLHSSIGFVTLALYTQNVNVLVPISLLGGALPIVLAADYVRLRNPRFAKFYEGRLGFLMRDSEKHKINGVVWYLIGTTFVLTLYPTDVAVVSILILSWADTAASTIGRAFGRYTPPLPDHVPGLSVPIAPRKSLAGFAAAWFTGSLIAFTFWATSPLNNFTTFTFSDGISETAYHLGRANPTLTWTWNRHGGWLGLLAVTLWSGLVTAVTEALDLGETLDDNLTLPIISGGLIWSFIAGLKKVVSPVF